MAHKEAELIRFEIADYGVATTTCLLEHKIWCATGGIVFFLSNLQVAGGYVIEKLL